MDIIGVDPQLLGQRIRQAREKQALSQEELAALFQVGQRAISELENGKRRLPVTDLPDLARILQVPLLYFFEGEVGFDDMDLALIQQFHRLAGINSRQTIIEIVRLLAETDMSS